MKYRNVKGQLHRDDDLPAIDYPERKAWYRNGLLDRIGGPAIIILGGGEYWYRNGRFHRDGGLPAIVRENGVEEWWVNGVRHRDGGLPAVFSKYHMFWYVNGELHRDRGLPAMEWAAGHKEWVVNGVNITAFREKYREVHRIRAQKKIYFWIIQRLNRPGSDSAKRLAEASWQKTLKEMQEFQN
jgi:hypothetical protein